MNKVTLPTGATYYQDDTLNGSTVVNMMDQTGIAWKSDIETKFKNIPVADRTDNNLYLWQNARYRWIIPMYQGQPAIANQTAWTTDAAAYGVQDEHFIVWMRTAGLPSFRKLYGRIDTDLDKGTKLQFLVSSSTFAVHWMCELYTDLALVARLSGDDVRWQEVARDLHDLVVRRPQSVLGHRVHRRGCAVHGAGHSVLCQAQAQSA